MADVLRADEPCQRIAAALRCRQDEGGARDQNRRNLRDRGVEARRCELKNAGIGCDGEALDLGSRKIENAAMRDADALRGSRRAGGVDDIGGVLRIEAGDGRGCGLRRDRGPVGIEAHDARAMCGQAIEQCRVREQHRRAGVVQHEGEPLGRIVGVERQVGAAGLEDAEQADDHLGRALDAQPHHHLGTDAERAQMMRQLVGARIELAIGEALVLEHHRGRIRGLRHLRREQLRQGGGRDRTRGVVPVVQDGAALGGAENVEAADRPLGIGNGRLEQSNEAALAIASALARSNRSVAYSRLPAIPAGEPSAPRCSARLSDRSNLALALATGSKLVRQPRQAQVRAVQCSATPASPGTADAAPASAPG